MATTCWAGGRCCCGIVLLIRLFHRLENLVNASLAQHESSWPHRAAVLVACATFPLIWVGGLVTTTDAGMAVPDWPNTYGYNIFLYPFSKWFFGPWDLFVEHGHRLLGALVGFLTIVLLCFLWKKETRTWVKWFGVAMLLTVVFQGVLGGGRVILDERLLAMAHGCTAPIFFAMTIIMSVVTSRRWKLLNTDSELHAVTKREIALIQNSKQLFQAQANLTSSQRKVSLVKRRFAYRFAIAIAIAAYTQLTLGAQLRHAPPDAPAFIFRLHVLSHVGFAFVLASGAIGLFVLMRQNFKPIQWLRSPSLRLTFLLLLQLFLGSASWVAKFALPIWLVQITGDVDYTIAAESLLQTSIVTAHVAIGSVIIAYAVVNALRAGRVVRYLEALEANASIENSSSVNQTKSNTNRSFFLGWQPSWQKGALV